MTPDVAIVLLTRNGGMRLQQALDAIRSQRTSRRVEILAIDSGSSDATVHALRSAGARVTTIEPCRFNHGATRNEALGLARAPLAVLMVQDAVPASDAWLDALIDPFALDDNLAGTFARQLPWPDASAITTHYLSQWVAAGSEPRSTGPLDSSVVAHMRPEDRHRACVFDNVCSCVRMAVWHRFPFRPTAIAEDLAWALEVQSAGCSLRYVPSAAVWHSHDRGVRYELQRTYLVHQQLQRLFGMSTVPSFTALMRAVSTTVPLHARLAMTERRSRARALAHGLGLAVAMPLGQYLGARSAREGREFLKVEGV
jgi:rhamnosyltransferase